jgi:hypothetical protein
VVVRVGIPPDVERPGLAGPIYQQLTAEYGTDIEVRVLYLEMEFTGGAEPESDGEPGRAG